MAQPGQTTNPAEKVRRARREIAGDTEPLNSERRKVTSQGGSVYINPTEYGYRTLDLTVGEKVDVNTYRDCIVIVPVGGRDE